VCDILDLQRTALDGKRNMAKGPQPREGGIRFSRRMILKLSGTTKGDRLLGLLVGQLILTIVGFIPYRALSDVAAPLFVFRGVHLHPKQVTLQFLFG